MRANPLETALGAVVRFLEGENVPYMVIGAIAGLVWGVRRATFDVDVTLWGAGREEELAGRLAAAFTSRAPDPAAFVRDTGVLPLAVDGTPVDVVFGQLPFEKSAIARAPVTALGGLEFRVCSAEDLVVHKIISDRSKDLDDVREIVRARGARLDRAYLDPIVKGLARELAKPSVWKTYLSCF